MSKSAIVPSIVRHDDELVEANAKLGVLAGLAGAVAIVPAGLMQLIPALSGWGPLVYARGCSPSASCRPVSSLPTPWSPVPTHRSRPRSCATPGCGRRRCRCCSCAACVGFLFFHLAFWLRTASAGTFWFGLSVTGAALGTMLGNLVAPRVRSRFTEERMLSSSLMLVVIAGGLATVVGGTMSGVVLAATVNFAAATGRLAFESLVQQTTPHANRGQTFARFETRFQLGWVVAGVVPVMLNVPGRLGFLIVAIIAAVALGPVLQFVSARWESTRAARARVRERPAPPASGPHPPG